MPLQATSGAASYDAFGGGAPTAVNYIENVFSTWLYRGNDSNTTVVNNMDLATKGGLVWIKNRSTTNNNMLFDTDRGIYRVINSNTTAAEVYDGATLAAFNTDGFRVLSSSVVNDTRYDYASWTFLQQPKFFDVVTYTGTGSTRTVAHNLGSVPGCIIVKRVTSDGNWQVYHRSTGNNKSLYLNDNSTGITGTSIWNDTDPTSTVFTVGSFSEVNQNGETFVAYIFAHDAGGFGLTGTDNVISCGSYTGTGAAGNRIELGYEPQFILYKRATGGTGDWGIHDNMRRLGVGASSTSGSGNRLTPNTSDPETGNTNFANVDATGFTITATVADVNGAGSTFIYIAIRRGPMRTPTTGTSVFSPNYYASTTPTPQTVTTNFPVDLTINTKTSTYPNYVMDRLRGRTDTSTNYLQTDSTNAEVLSSGFGIGFDNNTAVVDNGFSSGSAGTVYWNFRRAPGFFDVVCYTGTGVARTVAHNLGVAPEMMLIKVRTPSGYAWRVYAAPLGVTQSLRLNSDAASETDTYWNGTTPTSTVFSVNDYGQVNNSGSPIVAYLFATCAGVSKVGSYTGNGSSQTINCGFTGGARFVMVKRTDSTGDWLVYDSARGIVSGNDPVLKLNNTDAESSFLDTVDTDSTGFIVNQNAFDANASGGTYIFLAIA